MIKPTRLSYLALAAALASCDAAPASSASVQELTDTTVLPATGWGDPGQPTPTIGADGSVSWCCTNWYVPLPAGVGDAIGSLSTTVRDNGAANGFATSSNNVIVALLSQTASGSTVLGSVSSDGSGTSQAKTVALTSPHVVVAGESLIVKAIALAGGATPGPASHASLIGPIRVIPPTPTAGALLTLQVPIVAPGSGVFPNTVTFSAATGGHYSAPIFVTVGSTVHAVRIVGFAAPGTKFLVGVREADAIGNNFVFGAGSDSSATTALQTVSSAAISERVTSGINYACEALITAGSGSVSIHSCEVDYAPPAP